MRSFVFWILFICLCPFFLIGTIGIVKTFIGIRHLNSVNGIVTDNIARTFADGTTSFVPEIKFKTATGVDMYLRGKTAAIPAVYEKGEIVAVLYNPLKPNDILLNSFRELWLEDLYFIGISSIIFAIAFSIIPKDL